MSFVDWMIFAGCRTADLKSWYGVKWHTFRGINCKCIKNDAFDCVHCHIKCKLIILQTKNLKLEKSTDRTFPMNKHGSVVFGRNDESCAREIFYANKFLNLVYFDLWYLISFVLCCCLCKFELICERTAIWSYNELNQWFSVLYLNTQKEFLFIVRETFSNLAMRIFSFF